MPRLRRFSRPLVALALAAATLAAARQLSVERERPYDVDVVPPTSVMRWLSLGHATLVANLYWLRTVQYIGEPRGDERGWGKLLPLADLVTDLDPGHGYAYQVAGLLLGVHGRVDESDAILEKGTRAVPARYILPYLRAFNAYFYEGDWEAAGYWVEAAARAPGAPAHIRQNVLAYYVKGKRPEAALVFLQEAWNHAQDEESRKALEQQIASARFEIAAAPLDAAIAAYRKIWSFPPLATAQLLEDGFISAVPPDPYGGTFYVGDDGRVRSTAHPQRLKPAPNRAELGAMPFAAAKQEPPR